MNMSSRSLFAVARPSVVCRLSVCLSVTLVHPTQAVVNFGNFSTAFVPWPSVDIHIKFLRRSSQENPSVGGVKHKTSIVKYSDFGTEGKLVLITYRKLYMSCRLVSKSVILNDLERRNGPYSALFHRIR